MARILVVDDEAAVVGGLLAYLAREGVAIDGALGIEEARKRLGAGSYDLVLSDLRMSSPNGHEGLELLGEVRAAGQGRFVLMTAWGSPETEEAVKTLGGEACLAKPLDLALLDRLVDDLVADLERQAERAEPARTGKRRAKRMSDPEASALLARWAEQGDAAAFETLEGAFRALVHSVPLHWYHLSPEEAEDVHQEVMLELIKKAKEIRNPRLWMIGAAVNCSRRRIGASSRQSRIADGWMREVDRTSQIHVDAEADLREVLRAAVGCLPAKHRAIMEAIYYEGLSYREIAKRFGMPEGSIGPTRGRIVQRLIEKIRGERIPAAGGPARKGNA